MGHGQNIFLFLFSSVEIVIPIRQNELDLSFLTDYSLVFSIKEHSKNLSRIFCGPSSP